MSTAASATLTPHIKINAVGTWNLACACASIDCAIAYVSTDYVFDGEAGRAYTEFDNTNPMSAYGASKLAGELAVREICRKHYVVRTSWLFAPHGNNFALTMLKAADGEAPLKIVADQFGSPTYAKDLGGVFGVAGGLSALRSLSLH